MRVLLVGRRSRPLQDSNGYPVKEQLEQAVEATRTLLSSTGLVKNHGIQPRRSNSFRVRRGCRSVARNRPFLLLRVLGILFFLLHLVVECSVLGALIYKIIKSRRASPLGASQSDFRYRSNNSATARPLADLVPPAVPPPEVEFQQACFGVSAPWS